MANQEDPELDFTDYMEKQKSALSATTVEESETFTEPQKHIPATIIRGIIFFIILLALLGVLIYLFMNKPETGGLKAPPGYRINDQNGPPRLEKIP